MKAIELAETMKQKVDSLSATRVEVTLDEIKRLLNFCDKLSSLPKGAKVFGDEDVETMQIASFMVPFLRPREVTWSANEWDYPNIVTDRIDVPDGESCCDSAEFNLICGKIAKKLKFNMTTVPVGSRVNSVNLSESVEVGSIDNCVVADYNYDYLPCSYLEVFELIIGENTYVKEFKPERFVHAVLTNAMFRKDM